MASVAIVISRIASSPTLATVGQNDEQPSRFGQLVGSPLARIRNLPRGDVQVLPGDIIRIVGSNGSGKSALLRQLAGLTTPWATTQVDVYAPAALVFQEPAHGLVGLTVAGEMRLRGVPATATEVGISLPAMQPVHTLSTGEAAMLGLALSGAPLLLIDETAQCLDGHHLGQLAQRIRAHAPGACIFVDHHERLPNLATKTIHLDAVTDTTTTLDAPPAGAPVHVPGAKIARGQRVLHFPPRAFSPGLHTISGRNGAGKSTWLAAIATLVPGIISTAGGRPIRIGRDVRMLLPGAWDHLHGESVAELVAHADEDARVLVPPSLMERHPLTLSGGEARRVALAIVLGVPAAAYLLDEPDAHLDDAGFGQLIHLLNRRIKAGAVVLAATHDVRLSGMGSSCTEVNP